MTFQVPELESRLRRVERLTFALALFLGVSVVALALVASRPAAVVQAQSFELIDNQGAIIALLGRNDDRTGLFILDEQSTPRVSVFHAVDTDGLHVDDIQGVTRIGVAQFAHGGGGFALHGPDSKGAAVLYYKDAGSLRFFDEDGKVLHTISVPPAE